MTLVLSHENSCSVTQLCQVLGMSRATYYRWKEKLNEVTEYVSPSTPKKSFRRIPDDDRNTILNLICSDGYGNLSPYQIYADLLQKGEYLCSIRTMYRVLEQCRAVKERRNQRTHPQRKKPVLLATGPNQVWTWDITVLPGPYKGISFYLYVILDLFSRRVVGWCIESKESAYFAKRLVSHAIENEDVEPKKLTIHADRGAPMTSYVLYALFTEMGVTGSHSRPRTSNDNAFSESQFKTVKYHHQYPKRFDDLQHVIEYFEWFFNWYNENHYHINLGLFTPNQVHYGEHAEIQKVRQEALDGAYEKHPERFVKGCPNAPKLPTKVAINGKDLPHEFIQAHEQKMSA